MKTRERLAEAVGKLRDARRLVIEANLLIGTDCLGVLLHVRGFDILKAHPDASDLRRELWEWSANANTHDFAQTVIEVQAQFCSSPNSKEWTG